ncbi:trypco2 family protein [Vibrio aestuarianus]|uniref:trypco2 family protein n=1 Tax=Vibrio aestuarianus TaxID=28171 RepID=UPI0040678768
MKGNISLKAFIEEVKEELRNSINDDDPFFIMGDVELEVSFALDAEAKAGAKLFVLDVGGSTKATQTHKVKLTLSPFVENVETNPKSSIPTKMITGTKPENVRSRIKPNPKAINSPTVSGSRTRKNRDSTTQIKSPVCKKEPSKGHFRSGRGKNKI